MEKEGLLIRVWKEKNNFKHTFKIVNVNQEDLARVILELERILNKLKKVYNRKAYDNDMVIEKK